MRKVLNWTHKYKNLPFHWRRNRTFRANQNKRWWSATFDVKKITLICSTFVMKTRHIFPYYSDRYLYFDLIWWLMQYICCESVFERLYYVHGKRHRC